jgi:hypothetical protein
MAECRAGGGPILAIIKEGTLMASDSNAPRSRRALLAAAAGGAAAMAATAALPLTAAAADGDTVTVGGEFTGANETSLVITSPAMDPQVAFRGHNTGADAAGVIGSAGDETEIDEDTPFTGVYGWSEADPVDFLGSGVWGSSPDTGVVGTGGGAGVLGLGPSGVVGFGDPGGVGVDAIGFAATDIALRVDGKVQFSRSGKSTIGTGKSSLKINLAGVSGNSRVFAVLHSNRSGRYVRAVVPTTGSFTIYLNTTVTSATFVAWFVIN